MHEYACVCVCVWSAASSFNFGQRFLVGKCESLLFYARNCDSFRQCESGSARCARDPGSCSHVFCLFLNVNRNWGCGTPSAIAKKRRTRGGYD